MIDIKCEDCGTRLPLKLILHNLFLGWLPMVYRYAPVCPACVEKLCKELSKEFSEFLSDELVEFESLFDDEDEDDE